MARMLSLSLVALLAVFFAMPLAVAQDAEDDAEVLAVTALFMAAWEEGEIDVASAFLHSGLDEDEVAEFEALLAIIDVEDSEYAWGEWVEDDEMKVGVVLVDLEGYVNEDVLKALMTASLMEEFEAAGLADDELDAAISAALAEGLAEAMAYYTDTYLGDGVFVALGFAWDDDNEGWRIAHVSVEDEDDDDDDDEDEDDEEDD